MLDACAFLMCKKETYRIIEMNRKLALAKSVCTNIQMETEVNDEKIIIGTVYHTAPSVTITSTGADLSQKKVHTFLI
jgi:hypothetical protein